MQPWFATGFLLSRAGGEVLPLLSGLPWWISFLGMGRSKRNQAPCIVPNGSKSASRRPRHSKTANPARPEMVSGGLEAASPKGPDPDPNQERGH